MSLTASPPKGSLPSATGTRGGRVIKPKGSEVSYSGRIFRSKLEARWAVFLDLLSINWDYEPCHYQVGEDLWYLPDFYLPELAVWLEVKGVPFMDAQSMAKVLAAVAGPRRIPLREAPYSPSEHILLGGSFRPLRPGEHPVHTLVGHDGGKAAYLAPVRFHHEAGMWLLVPAGKPWKTMKATGVPERQRPDRDFVEQLLEPTHMGGTPSEHLADAYRTATRLKFDDTKKKVASTNDPLTMLKLVRRRAGRPLPKELWPSNHLRF